MKRSAAAGPVRTGTRASPADAPARRASGSVKYPAAPPAGSALEKVLSLIRAQPGIRPSEVNRRLGLSQSDALRSTLLRRGLIRKKKDGSAMRYYPA